MSDALAQILIRQGRLSEADLSRARRLQEQTAGPLDEVLVRMGAVSERHAAEATAEALNLELISADDYPDSPVCEEELSAPFLQQAEAIPLRKEDDRLVVAMAQPDDAFTRQALRFATGLELHPVVGLRSDIESAFERLYGEGRSAMEEMAEGESAVAGDEDIEHLRDMASEAPVIRLVNTILSRALEAGASDVHVEPFEGQLKVRYRVDGVLQEAESPPAAMAAAVTSRIKILARLNIAERRLPQDGRIQLKIQGRSVDFRVSTVPTMHGESVVMRILDRTAVALELDSLGFTPEVRDGLRHAISRPHGIILVTGPTGSGKTTTLYAALREINTPERKILTAEDPVEYQLDGINQIQVSPKIDLTFARALRSFLRQDPDVILVGEMRDRETANIAIQAALTGHMVLSTLHTNDAPSAITRLLDMGVEDYLITSTVNAIMAQRLLRTLCPACKAPYVAEPALLEELGWPSQESVTFWRATGCDECFGTGYRGRTGIHEFLVVDESVRALVMEHADASVIATRARESGMRTMFDDGLDKARQGLTSVEEVRRVTQM